MKTFFAFLLLWPLLGLSEQSPSPSTNSNPQLSPEVVNLPELCLKSLKNFGSSKNTKMLAKACQSVQVKAQCQSVEKVPIFHFDRSGTHKSQQRILVFSLIHGDETPAGAVGRFWMERLTEIEPRNTWRVVPVLNPDGVKLKTRTNANKVDLNRNFPTQDWDKEALPNWKKENSNPRRYPGPQSASEPETRCALEHIEEFKPNLIVSVHTPLKVLDFDGPRMKVAPNFDYLPWKSLGHYPGSLGRLMWFEKKVPVLTAEFKEDSPPSGSLIRLQDILGYLVSLEFKNPEVKQTPSPKPR